LAASATVAGLFFIVDFAFFASNLTKLFDGGYVPLTLAALVYLVMYVWHKGITAIANRLGENPIPVDQFIARIE
jgi:KUP system potassium uptake protein